ncbi:MULTISPECIES: NaeI family type II restriction endonuclease [unclassified Roseibium]|uniref:NaeI family type II restriction endonuclease n=1 Tax=unclassified Roseibium TaxID=2629323 RepID=UPI00273E7A3C|nr:MULTISPECIES: NaeI family type II restriction endonuclease [unclassified Roseibium]
MKKNIPESIVLPGHRDFEVLSEIANDITLRAGGSKALAQKIPLMLRECIDAVIETPRTGRRSYDELEKTEKIYIGTRVEIMLRSILKLPKGKLDTVICGYDVDIKNTMKTDWEIPREAIGHPLILVAADEQKAQCYLGLIIARPEYLNPGRNHDKKRKFKASEWENIFWLLKNHPYPPNFWRTVPSDKIERIFAGSTGNQRVTTLFREVLGVVITRDVVDAVGMQLDNTRRLRADDGKGTRDDLAKEGIALLSGDRHTPLIVKLGLPKCSGSEWISYKPTNAAEADLCRQAGINLIWPTI